MSNNLPKFQEYLDAKGKLVEKPKEKEVADYDGPICLKDPAEKKKGKLRSIKEYLDEKGKLAAPKVTKVADYTGPDPKAPEAPKTKGKNWDSGTSAGTPSPYRTPISNNSKSSSEEGFADKGSKDLVYEPDTETSKDSGYLPGGKVVDVKSKTESFINKTKNMSMKEFTEYMVEECGCAGMGGEDSDLPMVNAYSSGKFHPYPPEAIKYVVVLADKNEKIMENLVHEMKRSGGLGKIIKSLMEHPEAYDEMTSLFEDGEEGHKRAKKMAGSMADKYSRFLDEQNGLYETVSPPVGIEDDSEDEEGNDEDGDMNPQDSDSDEENPDGEENPDMGDDEQGLEKSPDGTDQSSNAKKLKKKFAHHNVIDAMAGHPPMLDAMKSYMNGY